MQTLNPTGLRLLFVLLIGSITLLALAPAPPPQADLGWDKLNHLAAFGLLGGLAALAWPGVALTPIGLALFAYGLGLEGAQALLPPREASALDGLANALGLVLGLGGVGLRRRRTAAPADPPSPADRPR